MTIFFIISFFNFFTFTMELKTINKITFSRLSNAYHVSFLSNVKADLEKYGVAVLGIATNLYENFVSALTDEQDIVNRSRASVYTKQLAEHDKTRDNYFRRIYYKLRNAENDSQNAAITPEIIATINTHFLNQYPLSVTNEPNQVETAKIRGFIKDLKQYLPEHFTLLEIATDIDILESANDQYEDAYMARLRERNEAEVSSECRLTTERLYLQMTYQLAATANSESDDAETMVKIGMCRNVIDEINLLIRDFKSKAYRKNDNDNDDDSFDEDVENV